MQNQEMTYSKYIKKFSVSFVACLSFLWLIISLVDWCFSYKILGSTKLHGFIYLVFISVLLSMCNLLVGLIIELKKSKKLTSEGYTELQMQSEEDAHVVDTLFSDLKLAFDSEKWQEVIKIGSVLSRPLWVTGKYSLRINIGKLVEAASAYSNNQEKQASTLIDDLGWTYVALKDLDEAKKNINHGLEIAKNINNPIIACKGTRHLSGICLREKKIDEAKIYSDKAKKYLVKISDPKIKKEMEAGLFYLDSVILKTDKKYHESLAALGKATEIYRIEKDNDRYSKCLTLNGNILLEMNDYSAAKDVFRKSLSLSKQISREDQVIENYLGLGKILTFENEFEEAQKNFKCAYDSAESIGNEKLAQEIKQKYRKKGE